MEYIDNIGEYYYINLQKKLANKYKDFNNKTEDNGKNIFINNYIII